MAMLCFFKRTFRSMLGFLPLMSFTLNFKMETYVINDLKIITFSKWKIMSIKYRKDRKLLWYKRKYTQEMVYKIYVHMREDSSK